jgi:hypothetical protein
MKKLFLILIGLLLCMTITNPSEKDHIDYFEMYYSKEYTKSYGHSINLKQEFMFMENFCLKRNDYIIFSVLHYKFLDKDKNIVIGVLGKCYKI